MLKKKIGKSRAIEVTGGRTEAGSVGSGGGCVFVSRLEREGA